MNGRERLHLLIDCGVFDQISPDMTSGALNRLLFEGGQMAHDEAVNVLRLDSSSSTERVPHTDVVAAIITRGMRWLSFHDFWSFLKTVGRQGLVGMMTDSKGTVLPLVIIGPAFAPIGSTHGNGQDTEPWYLLIYPTDTDPEAARLNIGFGYRSIGWPTDWGFLALGK